MTSFAASERAELADTLARVGPDAPTKCEGWDTHDLAVHLVLRERRPDAAVGIVLGGVPVVRRHRAAVADAYHRWPWERLLHTFRAGAPLWWPLDWPVLSRSNDLEFFVHHEDVRRAQPGWEPRELSQQARDALWSQLRLLAKLLYRRSPVSVVLRTEDGRESRARTVSGAGTAVVTGPVGELVLHAFGRGDVARVETTGDPEAVAELAATSRGI
ncbi:MAG: TIGR03085 family metal-binding protein [Actinomycetes bacterium]